MAWRWTAGWASIRLPEETSSVPTASYLTHLTASCQTYQTCQTYWPLEAPRRSASIIKVAISTSTMPHPVSTRLTLQSWHLVWVKIYVPSARHAVLATPQKISMRIFDRVVISMLVKCWFHRFPAAQWCTMMLFYCVLWCICHIEWSFFIYRLPNLITVVKKNHLIPKISEI